MFDPTVGQFISDDPIEFAADDPNLQRFVGNGSTDETDPSGLQPPNGNHGGGSFGPPYVDAKKPLLAAFD